MRSLLVTTADQVGLSVRAHPAVGERAGALLCTHAMMANAGYFERGFAQHLAERGVDVYVADWRGHGRSVPPDPHRERWPFEAYVQRDLPALIDAVVADAGIDTDQLCYLGHSLGGLVGLVAFATGAAPRPRLLTLWATSMWLPGPRGPLLRRLLMRIYDLASRPLGYAPIRAMRVGSDDEQRGYVEQLTRWAATGTWIGAGGVDYMAALGGLDVPVWAVNGDGDWMSRARDAQVILDALPATEPLRRVGTRRGDAFDPDHFTLFTRRELAPLWDELAERIRG